MAYVTSSVSPRRSMLFVPATRPDLIAKARAGSADMVCVDLEDAVAPDLKEGARQNALDFLSPDASTVPEHVVRINPLTTRAGLHDLLEISQDPLLRGILLVPKVSRAADVQLIDDILTEAQSELGLAVLIETLDAVENTFEILSASPRVSLAVFGAVDFSAELGAALADQPMLFARSRLVLAAKRAGVDVLDVPELEFHDIEAIMNGSETARALGFTGKAAIHPAGIDAIHAVFTPAQADVEQAQEIIRAFEASDTGLVVVRGSLIEKPVIRRMQTVLARARATGMIA